MAVIPLVRGQTIVGTEQEFQRAGARTSRALLIRNLDEHQLLGTAREANLGYDLRVGGEYRDHRDKHKTDLAYGESIKLLPGEAVIIQTEESVHLPEAFFGYIVPRVSSLQLGISNTMSKIDPGYNGPLLITLFNLGKRTVRVSRLDRFCSLIVHDVGRGAVPYDKPAKSIEPGTPPMRWLRNLGDEIQARAGLWSVLLIIATLLQTGILIWLALRGRS